MKDFRILSASEQLASHLKDQLMNGRWIDTMPGEKRLVAELGVGCDTVKAALSHLVRDGILINQGPGKRRKIHLQSDVGLAPFRVTLLFDESTGATEQIPTEIAHSLRAAGYTVRYASKTLHQLSYKIDRIERFARETETDAWVLFFCPREVLEYFASQPTPAIAVAGRHRHVNIASTVPEKVPAFREAVRHLVELGHRRIVLIARELRRKPVPGAPEKAFLEELEANGIPVGPYNLPDWQDDAHSLRSMLRSLFRTTPPTALLVSTPELYNAVQAQLARWGIIAPQQVSLICTDYHVEFDWCLPEISYLHWDSAPMIRRIVKWANNARIGKEDRHKSYIKTRFHVGGTVGPPLLKLSADVIRRVAQE